MNTNKLKQEVSKLINAGELENAFEKLWKIGVDAFILYGQKKGWLLDRNYPESANYFWTTFIINDQYFEALMTSSLAEVLLHDYYSKTNIFSKELEHKISKQYPETFVKAVKTNQVFFNREDKINRISFLVEEIKLPKELQIHQQVWKLFHDRELELWNEIQAKLQKIKDSYSLEKILFSVVFYIEQEYQQADNRQIKQLLGNTYSFFVELLFKDNQEQFFKTRDEIIDSFLTKLVLKENLELDTSVAEVLTLIKERTYLFDTYIDPYCFDKNVYPNMLYHQLYFTTKPEGHYHWKIQGIRYPYLEQIYYYKGITMVDQYIKDGLLSDHKFEKNKEARRECDIQRFTILSVLEDLELNNYYLGNEKIVVDQVVASLQTFAFNKHYNYENNIEKYRKHDKEWRTAYFEYWKEKKENANLPFVYVSNATYDAMNKKAMRNTFDVNTEKVMSLFQYVDNEKDFDRFRTSYSVFEQPFLKLGIHLFSPNVFFTSFTTIYTFVNSLLKNNSGKNDTLIEDKLASVLNSKHWQIKQLTKKQVDTLGEGDADVIVYNEDDVILMQLKRTNLRLNTKEAYYEYLHIDTKGAKQLNIAEQYFSKPNHIFNIEERKVHKWIVSTSHEGVNSVIDGCLKVNYMELLSMQFLMVNDNLYFNKLEGLIHHVKTDFTFTSFVTGSDNFENEKTIDEIPNYNLLYFSYDIPKSNEYYLLKSKGLELNEKGKQLKSIAIFNQCIYMEDSDVEIHGAIANVYADISNYEKAFFHFEKALQLLPNDPFITRNYIGALVESGNFTKAKELTKELVENYPLLKDIQELAKHIVRTLPL